jgi:hypothetical protein
MCTCITHMHAHTFYVLLLRDLWLATIVSWHGVFNEQFIFVLHFLLVNSITHRLPHQPRLIARREVTGGGSWNLDRSNMRRTGSFNIYRNVLYTGVLEWFIRLSENWLTLCTAVSLPCRSLVHRAADRGRAVSPNRRWWSETWCRRIRFLGSALARPLTLFLPRVLHRWFLYLFVHGIYCK